MFNYIHTHIYIYIYIIHNYFSAVGQAIVTHFLHFSLPSSRLFLFSKDTFMRSPVIPILDLPCGLFSNILPSNTAFSGPSPLNTCPIQLFFLSILFLPAIFFHSSFATPLHWLFYPINIHFPI